MANTLKLGTDNNWAVKQGSLLAYNDENNNFKPLPFDFTRNSSATRVNEQGLIETVGVNVPRIDFTDGKGSLLLEPTRSNDITYSEALSNTLVKSGTYTDNFAISPDGTQNATKLTATNADPYFYQNLVFLSSSYTVSIYIKGIGSSIGKDFEIRLAGNIYTDVIPSEWTRFEYTQTISAGSASVGLEIPNPAVTGDEVLVWGFQVEQGSYATSYIPTSGSVATRNKEICNNSSKLMAGLTDMAMYIDYKLPNGNSSSFRNQLGFRDNNNANFYMIQFPNSNTHEFRYLGNAGANVDMTPSISEQDFGLRRKILYTKTGTTLKVFCNGVEVSSVTSANATTFSNTEEILNAGNNYDIEMEISEWKLYNNGFTDQQAIELTKI